MHSRKCKKWQLCQVCLSVCPSISVEQIGSHCTDFHEIWYWGIFQKSVKKIQLSLKSDKNNGYMKTNIHFRLYLAHFFLEWEMLQTEFVDKIRRHRLCTLTFRKLYSLEIIWKNIVEAGKPQRTIWHMCIVCWIPKATNKCTLRICNAYCFSTETVVAWKSQCHIVIHCTHLCEILLQNRENF